MFPPRFYWNSIELFDYLELHTVLNNSLVGKIITITTKLIATQHVLQQYVLQRWIDQFIFK